MDPSSIQFFQAFKAADPDGCNLRCFDCGKEDPRWASVSHGIVICLFCSGQHRSFGSHVSYCRSLTMDSWNDLQMKRMMLGGNKQAKSFFVDEGIDELPVDKKYFTRAAKYYRALLAAKSTDVDESVYPVKDYTPEQATEIVEEDLPKLGGRVGGSVSGGDDKEPSGTTHFLSEFDPDALAESAGEIFTTAKTTVEHLAKTAARKMEETDINANVKSVAETAQGYLAEARKTVTDPNFVNNVEQGLSSGLSMGWGMMTQVYATASSMVDEVRQQGTDAPSLQKLKTATISAAETITRIGSNEAEVFNESDPKQGQGH